MTKEEAIKRLKAGLECLKRSTSGLYEKCNHDCENCNLNYAQGNIGEQKEALDMAIKLLEQITIEELQQHCVEYAKNSCKGCKHYKKHIGCKFRQGKVPREWKLL